MQRLSCLLCLRGGWVGPCVRVIGEGGGGVVLVWAGEGGLLGNVAFGILSCICGGAPLWGWSVALEEPQFDN